MNSDMVVALATVVTASATIVLAAITSKYVKLTHSLLKEQITARKINTIEKKLENFYIPLQQHILKNQYEGDGYILKQRTIAENFMKYIFLCQNEEVRSNLNRFLDPRVEIQNELSSSKVLVEIDIENLEKELNKLHGIDTDKN